jgi:hypothetical protein
LSWFAWPESAIIFLIGQDPHGIFKASCHPGDQQIFISDEYSADEGYPHERTDGNFMFFDQYFVNYGQFDCCKK